MNKKDIDDNNPRLRGDDGESAEMTRRRLDLLQTLDQGLGDETVYIPRHKMHLKGANDVCGMAVQKP